MFSPITGPVITADCPWMLSGCPIMAQVRTSQPKCNDAMFVSHVRFLQLFFSQWNRVRCIPFGDAWHFYRAPVYSPCCWYQHRCLANVLLSSMGWLFRSVFCTARCVCDTLGAAVVTQLTDVPCTTYPHFDVYRPATGQLVARGTQSNENCWNWTIVA